MTSLIAIATAAALALGGCGGGEGEGTTATSAGQGSQQGSTGAQGQGPGQEGGAARQGQGASGKSPQGQDTSSLPPPREGSKAAAPGVPTSKGGDNSIQLYGVEASSAERARATAIVQAFLDARAAANWEKACSYLAAEQRKQFEQLVKGNKRGNAACAEAMEAFATGVPASAFAEEADIVDVLSLRIGGEHAFLIYTRPDGTVYATALGRESGGWKVISVGPTALS